MKSLTKLALAAVLTASAFARPCVLPNSSRTWAEPQCEHQ